MKTLFLILSSAVLVAFSSAAYGQLRAKKKPAGSSIAGAHKPSTILQQHQRSCPDDPCEGEMKWVTIPEAVEMISQYGKNQYQGINATMLAKQQREGRPAADPFADSRYLIFPLDTIKKFICTMEEKLRSKPHHNANNEPIRTCDLGIKFYYAAYASHTNAAGITDSLTGKHTLIMLPTYWERKAGAFLEFFPGYVDGSGHPLPPESLYDVNWPQPLTATQLKTMMEYVIIFAADKDAGKNQGTLCPPPDACNAALLKMAVSLEK